MQDASSSIRCEPKARLSNALMSTSVFTWLPASCVTTFIPATRACFKTSSSASGEFGTTVIALGFSAISFALEPHDPGSLDDCDYPDFPRLHILSVALAARRTCRKRNHEYECQAGNDYAPRIAHPVLNDFMSMLVESNTRLPNALRSSLSTESRLGCRCVKPCHRVR